jgi:hypothetical protein
MANGDLYEVDIICPYCLDMSTSIVRIYTTEGFVIAADGRNYSLETKQIVSDTVQKIFPVEQPGRRLAYSISGTSELTPENSSTVIFDILNAIHEGVESLRDRTLKSLWHYCDALAEVVSDLPQYAESAVIGNEPPTIIYFDGYYDGRPKRACVKLFFDGQVPEISTEELRLGYTIGLGSEEIVKRLAFNSDAALAKYYTPEWAIPYPLRTLEDAVELSKSWMAAHCGPEAKSIYDKSMAIGGQVLIGTLTPYRPLEWVPGFAPLT